MPIANFLQDYSALSMLTITYKFWPSDESTTHLVAGHASDGQSEKRWKLQSKRSINLITSKMAGSFPRPFSRTGEHIRSDKSLGSRIGDFRFLHCAAAALPQKTVLRLLTTMLCCRLAADVQQYGILRSKGQHHRYLVEAGRQGRGRVHSRMKMIEPQSTGCGRLAANLSWYASGQERRRRTRSTKYSTIPRFRRVLV